MYLDPPAAINRLIVAVVSSEDAGPLADRLVLLGFGLTELRTAGGFLRRGNSTLLIGVPASRVDEVLTQIQASCKTRVILTASLFPPISPDMLPVVPTEVPVGGATVFILEVEQVVYLSG